MRSVNRNFGHQNKNELFMKNENQTQGVNMGKYPLPPGYQLMTFGGKNRKRERKQEEERKKSN
jgi:hypothetical protein